MLWFVVNNSEVSTRLSVMLVRIMHFMLVQFVSSAIIYIMYKMYIRG